VSRPTRIEHQRYLGDKRIQQVYDLDLLADDPQTEALVADLIQAETFITFGPDTLAEARNRGYRPHASIQRRLVAEAEDE
jgi:hypothetical protein